jgi:unconventional prefoldin RPB5 interactor 1
MTMERSFVGGHQNPRATTSTNSIPASRVTNNQSTAKQLEAISKKNDSLPRSSTKSHMATKPSSTSSPTAQPVSALSSKATPSPTARPSSTLVKSVSFAGEPEVVSPHVLAWSKSNENEPPNSPNPLLHPSDRVLELDENDQIVGSRPLEMVAPLDDDESRHAREALQNMANIGPIVASMDLIGAGLDDSDFDNANEESDKESLDEDEIGMTNIGAQITDDYKAEMEALMKKHEAAFKSDGPLLDKLAFKIPSHGPEVAVRVNGVHGRPRVQQPDDLNFKSANTKGVRFADDLDVSVAPIPTHLPTPPSLKPKVASKSIGKSTQTPFSESVIERTSKAAEPVTKASSSNRVSKFKAGLKAPPIHEQGPTPAPADNTMERVVIPPVVVSGLVDDVDTSRKVSRFKAARFGSNP